MKSLNKNGLLVTEQKFCDLYRGGGKGFWNNATACYMEVHGCKKSVAYVNAHRLINKPRVRAYLEAKTAAAEYKADVTQERITKELAMVAFGNLQNFFDEKGNLIEIQNLSPHVAATLVSMRVLSDRAETDEAGVTHLSQVKEFKLADKLGALNSLARTNGMFKDNLNLAIDPIKEMLKTVDGQGSTVKSIQGRIGHDGE